MAWGVAFAVLVVTAAKHQEVSSIFAIDCRDPANAYTLRGLLCIFGMRALTIVLVAFFAGGFASIHVANNLFVVSL